MTPTKILTLLKEICSANKLIQGLVLVGSYARTRGYSASHYSDLEAYIIVKDTDGEIVEKLLPELIKPLGKILFTYKNRWAGNVFVFDDLFRLELPLAKVSELVNVFSRPTAQEVKILIDKTTGKLTNVLAQRPKVIDLERLFNDVVEDFWYMFIVGVQYYKNGELWNARSVLQILAGNLIKLFELNNNPDTLLLETNKRVEQFLDADQRELLKAVSPIYDEKQIKLAFIQIVAIFGEATQEAQIRWKLTYSKEIEIEIKSRVLKLLNS